MVIFLRTILVTFSVTIDSISAQECFGASNISSSDVLELNGAGKGGIEPEQEETILCH